MFGLILIGLAIRLRTERREREKRVKAVSLVNRCDALLARRRREKLGFAF